VEKPENAKIGHWRVRSTQLAIGWFSVGEMAKLN
jgi:hypothetical protein